MAKRRFFGRKRQLHLIDERVSPLVLPTPPLDMPIEEDVVYGEDIQESIYEPLRVFIGSQLESSKPSVDHAWEFEDEDEISFDDISQDQVLQINIATLDTQEEEIEEPPLAAFSIDESMFPVEEESVEVSIGVATLAAASLPEEILLDEISTEEFFVPMAGEEEEHSVEHNLSRGEWLFQGNQSSTGVATLDMASLPIEEDTLPLEGELDFSSHEIDETIAELERREQILEKELNQEQLDAVFFVDPDAFQDFAVPSLPIKKVSHNKVVTTFSNTKKELALEEEKTEKISPILPISIEVDRKTSFPKKEIIAFLIAFWGFLFLLMQLL